MSAYYNENDPKAAAWLRELIKAGHIASGDVDERSIEDVLPNDLRSYEQCHFFAGIGGWSYALRLAGWPDSRPVWTGSCPCQPFSAAGKGKGFADERHLWPAWLHLIRVSRPQLIFGEQVANALAWLDLISDDLENEGYPVWAAVLGAHSVGAPHIRQRLYWVADRTSSRLDADLTVKRIETLHDSGQEQPERRSAAIELGDSSGTGGGRNSRTVSGAQSGARRSLRCFADKLIASSFVGDSDAQRQQQHAELDGQPLAGTIASCWADASGSSYVDCRDGKSRPVEPGTFPLAHGIPHRVGLLRGYGNAIVPQVAATFVRAYNEGAR